MELPKGKSRLDLVKEGVMSHSILPKRGRFIVSIEKLLEDPANERRTFRNMDGLIASVKAHGIIEPITVTAEGDHYRILTGHRRYRAARAAGIMEVEVIIRDPEDVLIRRRKSIISNVQREDIGAIEMAEALQSLLDEDKSIGSQRQLASLIGKTEHWVSSMLRILTLPAGLQKKLGATQVSVGYDVLIRVARIEDPDLQKQMVEAALQGETGREIRRVINDHMPERKSNPKRKGNGRGKSHDPNRVAFTEFHERCIASVRGPAGEAGRREMRVAVQHLLRQLE